MPAAVAEPYERQLAHDVNYAMAEGSRYFEESGKVHEALREITRRLDGLGVPYAVVGGLALLGHGYRRFTEDVDLLVTKEDLKRVHERLTGLGYLPKFRGSKHLRDTTRGVAIEFLTTGDYPGDGKPKPVAFPDPADVSVEIGGVRYVGLPTLVELKLASGMTNAGRLKDLADVVELTAALGLPREFADGLDPSVAGEFRRLWDQSHDGASTFYRLHPADDDAGLAAMRAEGASVADAPDERGLVRVTTADPAVARRWEMEEADGG